MKFPLITLSLLFAFILTNVSFAQSTEQVLVIEDKEYIFVDPELELELVSVFPGKTIKTGNACEVFGRKSLFHVSLKCSWTGEVTSTTTGLEFKAVSSTEVRNKVRKEQVLLIVSLGLLLAMVLCFTLSLSLGIYGFAVLSSASLLTASFGFLVILPGSILGVVPSFLAGMISLWLALINLGRGYKSFKQFYWIVSVQICLMGTSFFLG